MIIFVGDSPSKKNIDPNIPFVGTQSYKRLLEWIFMMDININDVHMCNKDNLVTYHWDCDYYIMEDGRHGLDLMPEEDKFIALGNNAEKRLKRLDLDYFKLPHPSGRNRLLNNEKYVNMKLKECKKWIKQ